MNYSLAQAAQLALHAFELEDDLPESTLCYEMRFAQRQMQRKEQRLLAMSALHKALECGEDTAVVEQHGHMDMGGAVVQMSHVPNTAAAPISVVASTPLAPPAPPVTSLRPNPNSGPARMAEVFKPEPLGSVQLKRPRS